MRWGAHPDRQELPPEFRLLRAIADREIHAARSIFPAIRNEGLNGLQRQDAAQG